MIRMELLGVRVELPANTPVVMLREDVGTEASEQPRVLPILIGGPEASAIHSAMEGIVPPRPLTHDLLVIVLETLNATLHHVVITKVLEHTFFAELHLRTAAGGDLVVSARPSDAIALAVRTSCEIFAEEALLDEAAIAIPVEDEGDEEAILDEFRDFLDDISPDDFAS